MRITPDFVKQLIAHSESPTLDVKSRQYEFAKSTKEKKSELLKDILTFANTLNDEESYILVGVKEEKPPPHTIVGISTSIDDADMQHFVNSKTNVEVCFQYAEVEVDQHTVGVVRIPPQDGPFIVRKDFGVVKHNLVLMRVGTSLKSMTLPEYTRLVRERTRHSASHASVLVELAQNRLYHLEEVTTDTIFEHCTAQIRTGNLSAAMSEIDRILSDEQVWEVLSPPHKARALRTKANFLLRYDELDEAGKVLDQADAIEVDKEPRIRALLTLFRSGPEAAIEVLGKPTTVDGRQLMAQLLIAKGDPKAALQALPHNKTTPASYLRPKALAHLLLQQTKKAAAIADEALDREPEWLDSLILAGTTEYFSALSPTYKPKQVLSPDPMPPALFRDDPPSTRHLQLAESHFKAALQKRIPEHERSNIELWLLAIYALQTRRHEDATAVLQSLVSKDPKNNIAILWGIAYGLDFDRDLVRETCTRNLESESGSASDVVSLLLIESAPSIETLEFLERHRSLFETQRELPVYEHWRDRLLREVPGVDCGDPDATDQENIDNVIDFARTTGDWAPIGKFIDDHEDDPISLIMSAEALAAHGQWPLIAKYAERLTTEIATATSFRIAATALLNVGEESQCLDLIDAWEANFSDDDRLPIEFWRLRSVALTRLGDVPGALKTTAVLLKESEAKDDVGRAINMHLRFGDVRAAAPFIAHLVGQDELTAADALNFSRLVQHDDEALAEQLLDHAAAKGVSPQQSAAAYEMAERLNRVDLSRQFLGLMAVAAETPGAGVRAVSQSEALTWYRQQRLRSVDVNELFFRGQIPLSLACNATNHNLVLRFEAAFAASPSRPWSDPLPVFHGSRAEPMQGLPDITKWILCLDLTTLLVLDEIDLLPLLSDTAAGIRVPFELPGALLELADKIALRQPARIATLGKILDAVDNGTITSDSDNRSSLDDPRSVRVQEFGRDSTLPDGAIGLLDLVHIAVDRGILDEEEARKAVNGSNSEELGKREQTLPDDPILVFDASTIENAIEIFGVGRLAALGTCVLDHGYVAVARDECRYAELRRHATKRVTALRNTILAGLKSKSITLLPQLADSAVRDEEIESSFDAILFSLLAQPAAENWVVGFDDRLVNRHRSTTHNPLVCSLDIIHYLAHSGALSDEEHIRALERLRDANLYFVPIPEEQLLHLLSLCQTREGALIETPRLRAFRIYVARCRVLDSWLNLEASTGTPNEMAFALTKFRLVDRTLSALWASSSHNLEDVESRANWVWTSLHVPVSEHLPVQNRNIRSLRELVAMQMTSLLMSSLTNYMTSKREDPDDWLRYQITWIWNTCLSPYLEGTPSLLAAIASHLRRYFSGIEVSVLEAAQELEGEEVRRTTRAFVTRFLMALPSPLRDKILADSEFAAHFGIQQVKTAEVGGVSVNDTDLRTSMVLAATTKKPQSLETSAGTATVELTRRGSAKVAALVTVSGAMSMIYQEPILGVLSGDRAKNILALSAQSKWIDAPPEVLTDLIRQCESRSDVDIFDRIDAIRNESAPCHYELLAASMSQEKPLDGSAFDVPPTPSLLRMLRLPTQSKKRFSFLCDRAAESLIEQYGPQVALERLGGLPVSLAPHFVDTFANLFAEKSKSTKSWLLSAEGSVLFRLHKLAVAAALSARDMFGMKSIRVTLRKLLAEWPIHAELFAQLLNSTNSSLLGFEERLSFQPEQRLALIWTHAHKIASVIHANTDAIDDATNYFRTLNQQLLGAALKRQHAFEIDVATPDLLGRHVLLYYGMSYLYSLNDQLLTAPLLRQMAMQLQLTDTPESPLSPRLLQQRDAGRNCLDSFLQAADPSFTHAFNAANPARTLDRDWFADRRFELRKGNVPDLSETVPWMEVLAHEQRWLEPDVRSLLVSNIPRVDWLHLLSESEDMAICVLLVIAEMLSYISDEADATQQLQILLTRCGKTVPMSPSDLAGPLDDRETRLPHMYSEAIYRAARSADVPRSCRMMAAGLGTIAAEHDGLSSNVVDLLSVIIPMVPVEHVQPLVTLRNRLMCSTIQPAA